ncbi:MAG: hypothetical protein EOP56_16515 [Sphingobacteriales bacterium]|nr:MAG: hypothetical protein EOP56_16515 [Sphingobacteriales bacterium]
MRKYLFGLAIIAVCAASCEKDRDMEKATVIDTGDIAVGGCGYVLKSDNDGTEYMPSYLHSKYRHNGYKVKFKFDTRGEQFICKSGSHLADSNRTYMLVDVTDIKSNMD